MIKVDNIINGKKLTSCEEHYYYNNPDKNHIIWIQTKKKTSDKSKLKDSVQSSKY